MLTRRTLIATPVAATLAPATAGAQPGSAQGKGLEKMFESDRVWNGVTTTRSGRVFVTMTQADHPGYQLQEILADRSMRPFPDAAWNQGIRGGDVASRFVQVNSLRIGPDGALWFIDGGAPAAGKPAVKGGARLFRVDLGTNRIDRTYTLDSVVGGDSFADDFRFNGRKAYVSDAGMPGLIVLDLDSGEARRVLDNHPSTVSKPLKADGRALMDDKGKEVRVHADQLEVSPDGSVLYFQPASGPISKVATRWLDDPAVDAATLASHVEHFVDVPTTGGTAIDAEGNIYVADEEQRRILRVTPQGAISTLMADERLVWADAMWIDAEGYLWIPGAQMNRTPGMNHGRNEVEYPVAIYRMHLGIGPSPIDHG